MSFTPGLNPAPKAPPTVKVRKPLQRPGFIARTVGVVKRNVTRWKANRERAYGSKERRAWVKTLPCCACGIVGYSENAHSRTGGIGRRADAKLIVPLCGDRFDMIGCHAALHAYGAYAFQITRCVNLDEAAEETQRAWVRSLAGQ